MGYGQEDDKWLTEEDIHEGLFVEHRGTQEKRRVSQLWTEERPRLEKLKLKILPCLMTALRDDLFRSIKP